MKNLLQLYHRHKFLANLLIAVVVVMVVYHTPQLVYAATPDEETNKLLNEVNNIFNLVLRFFSAWLWPVLLMIGSLLNNDLIFGGAMGERLLSVWVQIRNLVNIIFVLILLAIAVYNVLGLGQEGGGLPLAFKSAMPKFVLALVAVNFSFLAIKVVLDFSNVMTGIVFALPSATSTSTTQSFRGELEQIICGSTSDEVPFRPIWCEDGGQKFNTRAELFFSRLDRNNISVVYAIKFGHAIQLKFVRDGLKDLTQLGFNIIFNAVMYVVYALSFIALFLVLLFRLVVMWIAVVMSPFIALTIVLPNLKSLAGEGGKIEEEFTKNAIAPVTIGLILSVGYIMLDGLQSDTSLAGSLLSSSTLSSVDPHALPTDITDLQQLMIAIGTVVIVWTGVFSVASGTAARFITDTVRERAVGFGKFIGKLPTYAPIIPTSGAFGRDKVSTAEIFNTLSDIPNKMQSSFGRSLLDGAPSEAAQEALKEQRNAAIRGPLQYGRELSMNPHLIATREGNQILRQMLKDKKGMDEPAIDTLIGKNPADIENRGRLEELLKKVPELKQGLKDGDGKITSADDLLSKILKGKDEAGQGTDPTKVAPAAVTEATAPSLAATVTDPRQTARDIVTKNPAMFKDIEPAAARSYIDSLKKIGDEEAVKMIIQFKGDGVVDDSTFSQVAAAGQFAKDLKKAAEAKNPAEVTKTIREAMNAKEISPSYVRNIANKAPLNASDLRNAATDALSNGGGGAVQSPGAPGQGPLPQ